jgi:hypothetical protein
VGNGAQIRAWRDPWIPRESNYRSRSAQGRCRYRWVADFLHPDGSRNLQRLHHYFEPDEIEEIIKIKAASRNEQDFIAWHPEKSGVFIRSAYRLALPATMQHHPHGATSTQPNGERPSWKLIWSCPVPPKVKILTWKICRNAISTQVNMVQWGMPTTSICTICGAEDEDSFHVFMRCAHARALWQAMSEVWPLLKHELIKNIGREWLLHLLVSIPDV